ncbi:hypothetical protein [Aeromicrobium sp. CF3.5]|uniref:hypothetical protein n=1 Tax=Aeromicrobium sp. CF3.5 TaxID=3373078 RepID=UPI003EE76B1C
MKRRGQAAAVVMLCGWLVACGSDATDDPAPSASSSEDDVTAKIVADEPPTDVVWKPSAVPSGWRQLQTEQGSAQWQVGDSACVVGIQQPAGVGSDDTPTDDEIADQQVQQIGEALGGSGDLDVTESTVMVPASVEGSSAQVEQKFVERSFRSGDEAQGLLRAHRYGDFALIAYTACGNGDYEEQFSASIEGFLDSLTVVLTY